VTVQLVSAGQSVVIDPNVSVRVLHPANDFRGATDNANSIVLCLEYAGRRIVLTGDLEREGLIRLLRTERVDADVLLSPHHGSIRANSTDLARWATPEWLIASCRDNAVSDRLAANFGPATRVLTTARLGAIRCRIRDDGELRVEPFRRIE
jgi:competence protein ComEC